MSGSNLEIKRKIQLKSAGQNRFKTAFKGWTQGDNKNLFT